MKKQYVGAALLVCAVMVFASCGKKDTTGKSGENAVSETAKETQAMEEKETTADEKVRNLVAPKDFSDIMKAYGEEEIYNTWSQINYADEEKVMVCTNDGLIYFFDYTQNKVVRYINLREHGINGGFEGGDQDLLYTWVDKNCRYLYIKEWGMQEQEGGNWENVVFGKYRYDILNDTFEAFEFDEDEIEQNAWRRWEDEEGVSIGGVPLEKTAEGVLYGIAIIHEDKTEVYRHKQEHIVISDGEEAKLYFPYEPGREPKNFEGDGIKYLFAGMLHKVFIWRMLHVSIWRNA